MSDRLDEAHKELGKVVWSADKMSSTMPRRHHLRWTTDIIDESIKKAAVVGISPDNEEGDDEEYDYEDIHVRCLPLVACRRSGGLWEVPVAGLTPLPSRCLPSQALASLRRRLNRAFNTFERAKFEFVQSVILAIDVHDIVVCRDAGRTNGDRKFKSSLRPPRTGPRADMKDRLEYYWKVRWPARLECQFPCTE